MGSREEIIFGTPPRDASPRGSPFSRAPKLETIRSLDQQRLWKDEGACTDSVVIDRPENYSYLLKINGSWHPYFWIMQIVFF